MKWFLLSFCVFPLAQTLCVNAQQATTHDTLSIIKVQNPRGPTLGYAATSGVRILKIGKLSFKDLNKNGALDNYEDWRLPVDVRAKDLASKMTVEQIAGLMLYSAHQAIPSNPIGFGAGTYNGKPFPESSANAWDVTDQQKAF